MSSTTKLLMVGLTMASAACASSYPPPVQRSADAQSAVRGAQEVAVGNNNTPSAQLHLRLAQEGVARARAMMADGDNRGAEFALIRAKADAELALALARQESAQTAAQQAVNDANAVQMSTTRSAPTMPSNTTMPGGKP
jgi:multidrug efflux pump subunit AcrA (membrane-fusion protein)